MPKSDVEKFVDAVFRRYPEEAPKMAALAKSGRMGFGESPSDYGVLAAGNDRDHDKW